MVDVAGRRAAVASNTKYAVTFGNPVASYRKSMKAPATGCRQHDSTGAGAVDPIPGVAVTSGKFRAAQCHDQHLTMNANTCSIESGGAEDEVRRRRDPSLSASSALSGSGPNLCRSRRAVYIVPPVSVGNTRLAQPLRAILHFLPRPFPQKCFAVGKYGRGVKGANEPACGWKICRHALSCREPCFGDFRGPCTCVYPK